MSDRDVLTGLTKLQVLAEIEDVIRAMPERGQMRRGSPENLEWLGRATAAVNNWNNAGALVTWRSALANLHVNTAGSLDAGQRAVTNIILTLHQAQNDLRMKTVGPINVAIGHGHVFDYLDTLRKIIEQAKSDLLFVDRYINGDFVSTFMPLVGSGVSVRLLTWNDKKTAKHLAALGVMAKAFSAQHGTPIEVRTHTDHHERFVMLDGRAAFSSGPSFKDGPTTAGATINEQSGATLAEVIRTQEALWSAGAVEFKFP